MESESLLCSMRRAIPNPCCGPIECSVRRTISARVPCQTSVLLLMLTAQMSIAAFLWEDNRARPSAPGYPQLAGPGLAMMEGAKAVAVIVFLTARNQPLSALVELLSREFQMPIIDQTGLKGTYDFRLEFAPRPPGALPAPLSPD